MKRVFLIVLDSAGIGNAPDAEKFGDKGADTFRSCYNTGKLNVPNMRKLGLFNIDGMDYGESCENPIGAYGRMTEKSMGKDTTIGHWEIAGIISENPLPTYPNGFPQDILDKFSAATGRKVLCNKTYSGTEVIKDYGKEHMETGALIVYTSADSVFQIAAHESVVPVEQLYEYCEIARKILVGEHGVGRVIARPFEGEYPFTRTSRRHDFSIEPPAETMLDVLKNAGKDVIAVGKINDIFVGKGITEFVRTSGNDDGMEKTFGYAKRDFNGLCFVNLVDFDMSYGHRRDVDGYTNALNRFDEQLGTLMEMMGEDDVIMITADHGCDPCYKGTDHTRETVPLLVYGKKVEPKNLGVTESYTACADMVLEFLERQI
ncbi:MAG: phosphopentomutase [Oscillospiraceae bacterium]|nr:phosphopentomutase [Oscillospiraceae bacterium]